MWLCLLKCSRADILNVHVQNTQWTKIKQRVPTWQYIYHFQSSEKTHYTLANSATNAICATMQPLKLMIWVDTWWHIVVKNLTSATSAIAQILCLSWRKSKTTYEDMPPVIFFHIIKIPQSALIIWENQFEFNSVYKGTIIYANMRWNLVEHYSVWVN